jgi:hypothetical protein
MCMESQDNGHVLALRCFCRIEQAVKYKWAKQQLRGPIRKTAAYIILRLYRESHQRGRVRQGINRLLLC